MFTRSAHLYDAIYSFKDYAGEAEKLHVYIQKYCRRPCAALLDVACGTGAHIAHIKRRYAVEGVDLDEGMLRIAQERHPDLSFHHADMCDFDLRKRFDVVACLFSAIGYAKTLQNLHSAARCMANHLEPGGLLVLEPWILPERFREGDVSATFVDEPELKVARLSVGRVTDNVSWFDFHYLVATPAGVEHFVERHELGLFTHENYMASIAAAGLEPLHDPEGFGRGMYFGVR